MAAGEGRQRETGLLLGFQRKGHDFERVGVDLPSNTREIQASRSQKWEHSHIRQVEVAISFGDPCLEPQL